MSKYDRKIVPSMLVDGKQQPSVIVDVYDVEEAFEIDSPPLRHALKKILCAGLRGHKDRKQDVIDIIASCERELLRLDRSCGVSERSSISEG